VGGARVTLRRCFVDDSDLAVFDFYARHLTPQWTADFENRSLSFGDMRRDERGWVPHDSSVPAGLVTLWGQGPVLVEVWESTPSSEKTTSQ
jgi:hypothetical protein